jgi:5'-deoxynucleotidase YfbR-like HD superfamily hydrolase
MTDLTLKDIQKLYRKVVVPFHEIERDITLPVASHRPDNDAEHSWSLALMALSLAPNIDAKLDIGKVCIFATIHDVVEVNAGDTSVWAPTEFASTKREREAEALKTLEQDLPQFKVLTDHIKEYEEQSSDEAKFVYALDKFLNFLMISEDNGYYYRSRKLTKESVVEKLKNHRQKAHVNSQVGKYYDELRDLFDSNPDNFFQA